MSGLAAQSAQGIPREKRALELIKEYTKYEDSVAVTAALKIALTTGSPLKLAERVSIGGTLKRVVGSKVIGDLPPDLFATYRQGSLRGLVVELKWDVSESDLTLRNELSDLKRHFDSLKGFPLMDNPSSDHDVLLVAPRADSLRYARVAGQMHEEDKDAYSFLKSHRFAIVGWERAESKYQVPQLCLESVFGTVQHLQLATCLSDPKRMTATLLDVLQESARIYAVADEPPLIFRTYKLMSALANLMRDPRVPQRRLTEEEIHKWINGEFPPITPSSPAQVSRRNLQDTLKVLAELNYNVFDEGVAENASNGSAQHVYRIERRMPRGDPRKWLASRLAMLEEKELKREEKTKARQAKAEAKQTLVKVRSGGKLRRRKSQASARKVRRLEDFES